MSINSRMGAAIIAALGSFAAAAAPGEEIESHDAHQHGVALLNVGIEARRVEFEFESPAANLIGFEHAPTTAAEHAAVARAGKLLADGARLFMLTPAAECRLTAANVERPDWQDSSGHAEYEARYTFECSNPRALRSVDVRLVAELAADTKLRVQIASATTQAMTELTRSKSIITIP